MDTASFSREGFAGPGRVMDAAEAHLIGAAFDTSHPGPLLWSKGGAAAWRLLRDLSIRRSILAPVLDVLGSNVVLWGASQVISPPGHIHLHHVDIETADPVSRSVSVWIGLEGTSRESSLRLVARSHRFGVPIQQVALNHGRRRGEYGEEEILEWAGEWDPSAAVVTLDISDGEAIWFDGHLWHGSHNVTTSTRRALLLQYAAATTPIRIPDLSSLEWPFSLHDAPRPPCLVVAGEADMATNDLVPVPPVVGAEAPISAWTGPLPRLDPDIASGFRPNHLFRGQTGNIATLTCHVSTLATGRSPHAPHTHAEEEVLIMLGGEAELTYDDDRGRSTRRATPDTVAYYPSGRAHTISAVGGSTAHYLMFKWTGSRRLSTPRLEASVHYPARPTGVGDEGFRAVPVFEGGTDFLLTLHAHRSELDPGAGYEPHVDAHDVGLVLLEGQVDTLGTTLVAPALCFVAGGVPHGIRNSGPDPARYLVVEFHGNAPEPLGVEAGHLEGVEATSEVAFPTPTPPFRVRLWNWGGRLTSRFPRTKRVLLRGLGGFSPWR